MKSIDEVIDEMEFEVSYNSGELKRYEADALHYLKEYRTKHEEILQMEEALGYCEIAENKPLTWDELKQMVGKPVWVEHDSPSTKYKRWVLLCEYTDSNKITIIANHLLTQIMPVDYGKTWQAYRKERG